MAVPTQAEQDRPTQHVDVDVSDVIPVLGELVRAWSLGAGPAVRRVVGERLRQGKVVVVEDEGSLVAGSGPLLLVVRLSDLPPCRDPEGGVVVGEPPRMMGCGAQDLVGVAAFTLALGIAPTAVTLAIVQDARALTPVLQSRKVKAAWSPMGALLTGADRDVLDVVAADVGRLTLSLSAADADQLLLASGRAVAFSPAPRFPLIVTERLSLLGSGLWGERPGDVARDPARRGLVVDRCSLLSFSNVSALIRCAALPGRSLQEVVDDVVLAIDDPGVRVQVMNKQQPSSTSLSSPLPRLLTALVRRPSSRVVVAPMLDLAWSASTCQQVRENAVPCIAAFPLPLHPALRARRGQPDEAVPVDAVVVAAAVVIDVAAAVGVTLELP